MRGDVLLAHLASKASDPAQSVSVHLLRHAKGLAHLGDLAPKASAPGSSVSVHLPRHAKGLAHLRDLPPKANGPSGSVAPEAHGEARHVARARASRREPAHLLSPRGLGSVQWLRRRPHAR